MHGAKVINNRTRTFGLVLNTAWNGLDGGRDMHSFAGLYFILRPLVFIVARIYLYDFKQQSILSMEYCVNSSMPTLQ